MYFGWHDPNFKCHPMKHLLAFAIAFSALVPTAFAQPPVTAAVYLKDKHISKSAKDYYHHKFKAHDDKKTLAIIDSLTTQNSVTRPFYMYLVSKMMKQSHGKLSEALESAGKNLLEAHPDHVLDFLYAKGGLASPDFIDQWAETIAGNFLIDCQGKEKDCIKRSFDKAALTCSPANKKKLNALYQKIKSYCR
jgi:hypothetical protein